MLWTKRAHECAIFQTFKCSIETSPDSSCHFLQILHHCSVSWKITPLYFFSPSLIYFGQKEPNKVKFWDFWVVGWRFTKFLMSYLKPQVSFYLNIVSFFSVMRDNCSVLFLAETLYDLDKRRPSKCKISDFRLLTWNFTKFVLWQAPFVESI